LAGAVPHSTPILTDGALNLGESTLGVTGTAIFVMLLSLSTFNYQKIERIQK